MYWVNQKLKRLKYISSVLLVFSLNLSSHMNIFYQMHADVICCRNVLALMFADGERAEIPTGS